MKLITRPMIIALLAVCQFSIAQTSQVTPVGIANQAVEQAVVPTAAPASVNANANNNTNTTSVVVQPTTVVEASAVSDSQADRIRKARQDIEVNTEQKIIEKLEQSRLEDEKRRADQLFGNPTAVQSNVKIEDKTTTVQAVVVPAENNVNKAIKVEVDAAKQEIINAINANKTQNVTGTQTAVVVETAPQQPIYENGGLAEGIVKANVVNEIRDNRYYISSAIGLQDYTSGQNIEGKGSIGAGLGMYADRHFVIEGSVLYSNYYIEDLTWATAQPVFRELDQWNFVFSAQYTMLVGNTFRPYIGAATSTTYRKYYDRVYYGPYGSGYIPPTTDSQATSWSFDLIFQAGFDVHITRTFAVGLEYRYSTNMFYRTSSDILSPQYRPIGVPLVEESDYSAILITGKYRF